MNDDDVIGEVRQQVLADDDAGRGRRAGPLPSSTSSADRLDVGRARCRHRPGGRPARQSLIPLYCAGLCEAVNIAPGASSRPAA